MWIFSYFKKKTDSLFLLQIFHDWIYKDREEMQGGDFGGFLPGRSVVITVRRNFIYEDAYDRLRPENGE